MEPSCIHCRICDQRSRVPMAARYPLGLAASQCSMRIRGVECCSKTGRVRRYQPLRRKSSQGGTMPTKFRWSTLTILVVLTTGLLLAGQTYPAPQTPPQGHEAMGAAASSLYFNLKMTTEKLNLTDEQRAKLRPILQDQAQQL